MPPYRLSRQALDVVFKLEAEALGAALPALIGLDLPPIVRRMPTELPVAQVHLEELDSVFKLGDGSLVDLEFERVFRREALKRFYHYASDLIRAYDRRVRTIAIYGGGRGRRSRSGRLVTRTRLDYGDVQYTVTNVFLDRLDGEATLGRLTAAVALRGSLSPEERLEVVFLPLMRHSRPELEVVRSALALAERLPAAEQSQVVASLIGLGRRFLDEGQLGVLLEDLMKTSIGEMILERGVERSIERGREEGREQGQQQALLTVLGARLGPVPPTLTERIVAERRPERLQALLRQASVAATLDAFAAELD